MKEADASKVKEQIENDELVIQLVFEHIKI